MSMIILILLNLYSALLAAAAAIDPDVHQNYHLQDKSRCNSDDRFRTSQANPYQNYIVICEQDQIILADVDWASLIYDTPFCDDIADILESSRTRGKGISRKVLPELCSSPLDTDITLEELKGLICSNIAWRPEDSSNIDAGNKDSSSTHLMRIYALFFVSLLCAYLFLRSLGITEKCPMGQTKEEEILKSQPDVESVILACETDMDIGSNFDDSDYPMG